MQTAGNLFEEGILSGAVARYFSLDICDAIRTDREKDKRQGKTAKRKAKLAHYKWVACWPVLRTSEKFRDAANMPDRNMEVDDSSAEDGRSSCTSSPSLASTADQRRPGGIKAAKQMRIEDATMEKQLKASTAAVKNLAVAQQGRTALFFLDSPAMRSHAGGGQALSSGVTEDDEVCRHGGGACTACLVKAGYCQCVLRDSRSGSGRRCGCIWRIRYRRGCIVFGASGCWLCRRSQCTVGAGAADGACCRRTCCVQGSGGGGSEVDGVEDARQRGGWRPAGMKVSSRQAARCFADPESAVEDRTWPPTDQRLGDENGHHDGH